MIKNLAVAEEEEEDKPVVQVRASHKRLALQIYKKLALPKGESYTSKMVQAAIAMDLAEGIKPQLVVDTLKPAISILKAFILQAGKKIAQGTKEEGDIQGETPNKPGDIY